jgi:5-(carboxyamino)imidazole ribonucleotide mutase
MPNGVPVATVALNAAKNAGILAAQIIGASDEMIAGKIKAYKEQLNLEVQDKVRHLQSAGWPNGFDT